jgi:hypothetical protein
LGLLRSSCTLLIQAENRPPDRKYIKQNNLRYIRIEIKVEFLQIKDLFSTCRGCHPALQVPALAPLFGLWEEALYPRL